ncbi:lipopolysaccharide biosynthesis protein [Aeromonas rivipollensis]|uniref:lipopolysaccharide biosynthesis protein n=1 Tax=Aeromonas rivipollensis TaxID=948519 RepID=UPI0038DF978D
MTKTSNIKNRLIKGIGANAYGQAITVLTQLVSVPLFIQHWGISIYGEWLILSALPAYLSMSDFGLGAVAGNSMVMKIAQNDKAGALVIYRSVSSFNAGMSLLILLLSTVFLSMPNMAKALGVYQLTSMEIKLVLLLLVLQILVSLQTSILSAAYRSLGRYAEGTALINTSRLIEWIMGMAMLLGGSHVIGVAAGMLAGRLLGYGITYVRLQRLEPEFYFSVNKGSSQVIKELLAPGLAFLAFPLGLALGLQGMTLVIGSVLGAVAVAQFSVLRTLSRVLVQLVNVLNQATWPEISKSYAEEDYSLANKLHLNSFRYALVLGVTTIFILSILDNRLLSYWLGKNIIIDFNVFNYIMFASFISILGQASWVVLMATNCHKRFALVFLTSSIMSILVAFYSMPYIGLLGAALSVILSESINILFSIKSANALLKTRNIDFIYNVLRIR